MTTKVHAVYRGGVLLPTVPLAVAEGSEVELTVTAKDPESGLGNLAKVLEEIARLPAEGPQDGFSGAEHDRILYEGREKE